MGLGKDYYCHATSPIRRFADVVNQTVLLGYSVGPYDVAMLNERGKCAKKYERDMFFLMQVMMSGKREVEGMTLNDHRIWVPDWKRIVTCKNTAEPGTSGILKYSVDMDQPTWKKRMVFRFEFWAYRRKYRLSGTTIPRTTLLRAPIIFSTISTS